MNLSLWNQCRNYKKQPLESTWPDPVLKAILTRADCVGFGSWISSRTETPQTLDSSFNVLQPLQQKSFFLIWSGISYISVSAWWLLFCKWAWLRRVCLPLLYICHQTFIHFDEILKPSLVPGLYPLCGKWYNFNYFFFLTHFSQGFVPFCPGAKGIEVSFQKTLFPEWGLMNLTCQWTGSCQRMHKK